MKSLQLSAIAVFSLMSAVVWAETPAPSVSGKIPSRPGAESIDQRVKQHQEHLLKLHEMMHQIMNAKDETERERLKEEQLKFMKENMRFHQQQMRGHRGEEAAASGQANK